MQGVLNYLLPDRCREVRICYDGICSRNEGVSAFFAEKLLLSASMPTARKMKQFRIQAKVPLFSGASLSINFSIGNMTLFCSISNALVVQIEIFVHYIYSKILITKKEYLKEEQHIIIKRICEELWITQLKLQKAIVSNYLFYFVWLLAVQ